MTDAGTPTDITTLLSEWSQGDRGALDRLVPLVYAELRKIAARHLRREPHDLALQSTDLVHALFLQLVDQRHATWENREEFYAVAARMMRRILVDIARARRAAKRGGPSTHIPVHSVEETLEPAAGQSDVADVLAVDELLQRLEARDPMQARIVELRFFLGLSIEDTAATLGNSPATVKREWRLARAWLYEAMRAGRPH